MRRLVGKARAVTLAASAIALLGALNSAAFAQGDRFSSVTETARQVYLSCMSVSASNGVTDPRASCACITGYMGGSMDDRDFEVASILLRVGEMTESGAAKSEIDAAITSFFERGFGKDDIDRVAATVQQISARGDAVCSQFEKTGSI